MHEARISRDKQRFDNMTPPFKMINNNIVNKWYWLLGHVLIQFLIEKIKLNNIYK
jgi:hypothetical protein